jgi:chromosome segregation ATPase
MQSEIAKLGLTVDKHRQHIEAVKNDKASNERLIEENMEKTNSNTEKVENLSEVITGIDKQLDENQKYIELANDTINEYKKNQQNVEDTMAKQISEIIDNLESKSNSIDGLSVSVLNLESRYSETIERIEQVNVLVSEYEEKTKEIGLVFKDDQRKEMKSIENQLNTIYAEYEKIEKDMTNIKADKLSKEKSLDDFLESFNKDVEIKFEDLSKQTVEQTELMAKTDSKMTAIIEQASMLMVNDVKQDQTMSSLDKSLKSLDAKLSNLESADLFLQESHRQLTEKTMSLETQYNKFEDIQDLLKNQQREKIEENLKGKVNELLSTVGDIVSEQDILSKSIVSVEHLMEQTGTRVDVMERNIPVLKTQILEEVNKLDEITKTNIHAFNEKTMESLSNLQNEFKNALGIINDLKQKTDDRFQKVKRAGNEYDSNMKDFQEEIKDVKGMLVSLQFQAEKAQYVETLATKVSQIDEERQKKEVETKDEFEVMTKRNLEEINQLKLSFLDSIERLQEEFSQEKVFSNSEFEDFSMKLKDITNKAGTHEDKLSELEPYAQGINTKVAELENNIHERIGLLIAKSEEHRSMIEKSTTSLSVFSEKIVTYEKEQREISENLTKNSAEEFVAFKQEMDSKVSNLITQSGYQEDKIEKIVENISSMNEERSKDTEQLQAQKEEITRLKKEFQNENELIVKRFSEQKGSIESINLTLEQQFEKIDVLQANEVRIYENRIFGF